MISLPAGSRIWLVAGITDMRNGFNGLASKVQNVLKDDPFSEHLCIFNAMAESINGLYKAEVIHRKRWKNRAEVELATLTWVDWYNNRRLLERLGHIPPAEAEKAYYASIRNDDLAA